jgi:hypothetical protein
LVTIISVALTHVQSIFAAILSWLCHTRGAHSEGGFDRIRKVAQLAVAFFD